MSDTKPKSKRLTHLGILARNRVLVIDGGWGSEFQRLGLSEADYRTSDLVRSDQDFKGNHDLLNLSRPDIVRQVHDSYFAAGADFASSNTFSSTSISQADYGLESLAKEIAEAGARIAREAADHWEHKTGSPKAVLGSLGPTNKTLSISPNVNDPGYRDVTFDEVRRSYLDQARAMQPHVDAFLIETVFDTLNAKAAIKAVLELNAEMGQTTDIVLSGTITDASGRTLSGQTTEAFWHSIRHAKPWAVGLNCALGAKELRPYVQALSKIADTLVLAYPNAGLPNAFGEYDETPDQTASHLADWAANGLVNIVGGCCGTTPDHIQAIAERVAGISPRSVPTNETALRLSGLEPFRLVS